MNPGVGIPITTDIFYIEIPIAMLCQKEGSSSVLTWINQYISARFGFLFNMEYMILCSISFGLLALVK